MTVLLSKKLAAERDRIMATLPEFGRPKDSAFLLDYEEVLDAHFCIADFFFRENYGLGGVGPRDISILVSTVERQYTGFDGHVIFEKDYERIATLLFGIIKNHPFYDANKRSAFLCALLQLHRMGRVIKVREKEFEDLMVEIADSSIWKRSALREIVKKGSSRPEVRYLGRYLEKNSRKISRVNKTIKFRQLRGLIEQNGFSFRDPFKGTINIVKTEERRVSRFWLKDRVETTSTVVGNIAYHGEGVDVPDNTLRRVRQMCGLTDQDGYDGEVLLRDAQPTFQLISSYRNSLQRLAYR